MLNAAFLPLQNKAIIIRLHTILDLVYVEQRVVLQSIPAQTLYILNALQLGKEHPVRVGGVIPDIRPQKMYVASHLRASRNAPLPSTADDFCRDAKAIE